MAVRTLVSTPVVCESSMSRACVRSMSTVAAEPAPVLGVIAVAPEVVVNDNLRTVKKEVRGTTGAHLEFPGLSL